MDSSIFQMKDLLLGMLCWNRGVHLLMVCSVVLVTLSLRVVAALMSNESA